MNTTQLKEVNARAIHQASTILEQLSPKEIHEVSKEYPYFGYVNAKVGKDCEVVMLSNNDDLVAKHYLWNGADAYETATLRLWSELAKRSRGAIDVGSYTGVFSLVAAAVNPLIKVFAFEALDRAYNRLQINKHVNQLHRIVTFNRAVSNMAGECEFNVFVGENVLTTGSSLMDSQTKETYEIKRVLTVSLDEIPELQHCNLIKIDAEGAEHLVLEGGEKFIKNNHPDIIMEILQSANLDALVKFFEDTDYHFYSINDRTGEVSEIYSFVPGKGMHQLNTLVSCKKLEEIKELLHND